MIDIEPPNLHSVSFLIAKNVHNSKLEEILVNIFCLHLHTVAIYKHIPRK